MGLGSDSRVGLRSDSDLLITVVGGARLGSNTVGSVTVAEAAAVVVVAAVVAMVARQRRWWRSLPASRRRGSGSGCDDLTVDNIEINSICN